MTGFGEAQLEDNGRAYHLEIRSFNQRYLKTSIHLPDEFTFLESDVERLVRARLTRGAVTLRLHVRDLGPQAALELNTAAVNAYITQLRAAAGNDPLVTIVLATLLTVPGVCQTRELTESERERRSELLTRLVTEALDRLIAMRANEGRTLAEDLRSRCTQVRRALGGIREHAPAVLTEYRERLRTRIQELIADSTVRLAEEDLVKEVSIYAERSDISEELSRLSAHLDHFEAVMASPEPAGRKLEFISQEMLREANTMGSKTGDAAIGREIIEIKTAIDRIKEQVANAE
jgi:uncharacterized protein (TIGR00255 family)